MAPRRMWHADVPTAPHQARERLEAAVSEVTLEPGEELFIPVGWWHEVEALDVSATLACTDFHGIPNTYSAA